MNFKKYILLSLLLFCFFNCTGKNERLKILKDLDQKQALNAVYHNEEIIFSFQNNKYDESKIMTKKSFSKYELSFTPLKKGSLETGFSIYLHYQNPQNYYRLNIYLDTGKVHFYSYQNGKIENILYSPIKPFYSVLERNIYTLKVENDFLEFYQNNKKFYANKVNIKKGKVGFSAYGKKGEKASFYFKNN